MSYIEEKQELINSILTSAEGVEWRIVGAQEDESSFGNAFVCFDNNSLRLRFLREHDAEFLDIGQSLPIDEIDESLLFPFDLVAATLGGTDAVDTYIDEREATWQSLPRTLTAESEDITAELDFINRFWPEFLGLFQENSLKNVRDVQKRAEERISAILNQNNEGKALRVLENTLTKIVRNFSEKDIRKVIAAVADESERKQVEKILHGLVEDKKMQKRHTR